MTTIAGCLCAIAAALGAAAAPPPPAESPTAPGVAGDAYAADVRPLLQKYCLDCHSAEKKKGSLDLERFGTAAAARKDLKVWQAAAELTEAGEMPPAGKPQPTAAERARLVGWVRELVDAEARARAGDPGHVPLRRLSNAEYDYTVRDLTGVDLRPARAFPADGAAGEGFANAAEALADVSPALLNKYLLAAKDVAAHAVLLPNGFRFSPAKTRPEWAVESVAALRRFYAGFTKDGRLPLKPYLAATIRHRDALLAGRATPAAIAAAESLNPTYLAALWLALTGGEPSFPLDAVRARWRRATEPDVDALAADVAAWQAKAWKIVPIGSYRHGDSPRQVPNDAAVAGSQTLRLTAAAVPAAGDADVVIRLFARSLFPREGGGKAGDGGDGEGRVVWGRPRLEAAKKPALLLRDYPAFGPAYEVDYALAYADAAKFLAAVGRLASADDGEPHTVAELAAAAGLDAARLQWWVDLLAIEPAGGRRDRDAEAVTVLRTVPAVPLDLLREKASRADGRAAISGWRPAGAELPAVLANASDAAELIPGRVGPRAVVAHPTPAEFAAVAWASPVAGRVRIAGRVAHAHPACGNGVAWWLERHRGGRASVLAEGTLDLGKDVRLPDRTVTVAPGDRLVLAVDARDGDHTCDLTELALTITEASEGGRPGRAWDLAADVAGDLPAGNPHADRHGNPAAWSFVKGPTRPVTPGGPAIPPGSLLARWREAATDPARQAEARPLAEQVRALLTGPRPAVEKAPDRALYDRLTSADSPLLAGLDLAYARPPRGADRAYGLDPARFGPGPAGASGAGATGAGADVDDASVLASADSVVEVRLPVALLRGREFVVDVRLATADPDRAAVTQLSAGPEGGTAAAAAAVVAAPGGAAHRRAAAGFDAFRATFPLFLCFPAVIPDDEVVCLKMYHREDEPLARLFLDDAGRRQLDRLWDEHRFVAQQPLTEDRYLPQFIEYVTQDQPKELLRYYEGLRPAFRERAVRFEADWEAATPRQLDELAAFAARAYRRPLADAERAGLTALYRGLRDKNVSHEDAFRGVLARVLVAPAFLFRVEHAPRGKGAGPVNDWELATRLSYFLWSTIPDDALRAAAAAGRLRDPAELARQAARMLGDDRVRALGVEFGTQWIHVRGFDELKEKSETLFPTFDDKLRAAIYEESVLFFQDLFQQDRPIARVLDADYTYLNETLAAHYGIPGVAGPHWRRVDGVRRFGRGGVLGLASVQAKQAGASRTSPVLRGNWVLETLLGEKLPRPPADVPPLPEQEGADGLTTRQMVERHTSVASCRSCHERIDPVGFAFERYDPIGRLRDRESTGRPVDAAAILKDGTRLDGIDGLRNYLLTAKRDVVVRLFCRRLLGYALGRAVAVSDYPLLDEMVNEVSKNDGRVSAAVLAVVRSPQFRNVRGSEFDEGGN